eukprot:CAMPEP_0182834562 /NCGR_PEP_ID=MMETSP0006_2-20121128/20990_1 /TAXON_ID=97485 /ORGANISM="Prymnesium parvum, Strain Texoma1" /LENGTH=222 /DNA_ID=CAMNT_0024962835 /DNA_START=253 /DNA_END=917 /DNA_ORIENTATION=+
MASTAPPLFFIPSCSAGALASGHEQLVANPLHAAEAPAARGALVDAEGEHGDEADLHRLDDEEDLRDRHEPRGEGGAHRRRAERLHAVDEDDPAEDEVERGVDGPRGDAAAALLAARPPAHLPLRFVDVRGNGDGGEVGERLLLPHEGEDLPLARRLALLGGRGVLLRRGGEHRAEGVVGRQLLGGEGFRFASSTYAARATAVKSVSGFFCRTRESSFRLRA